MGIMFQMGDETSDFAGLSWATGETFYNMHVRGSSRECSYADLMGSGSYSYDDFDCGPYGYSGQYSYLTYDWHGVKVISYSSAFVYIMRQTALSETADGTGTDNVVRIEGGRVLRGRYLSLIHI